MDALQSKSPNTSRRLNQIRGEQTRTLYRNCPPGTSMAGAAAITLALSLERAGRVDVALSHLWIAMMAGCVVIHLGLCVLFWRARPPDADWRIWLHSFTLMAFVEGIVWLLGAFWLTSPTDINQELIVAFLAAIMGIGAVPVFGVHYQTYVLFMVPVIAPHLYFSLFYNYSYHELMAGFVVIYLIALPFIARIFNRQIVGGFELRFENMALIDDLRRQKQLADQANLAKSRFLASASHDLRQPIHALSLFIGALRARKMDADARRLVDHISGSVSAMDELFGSLLDISKLDAGAVEPQIEAMAIAPLLERLCREHRQDAAAKGIALRFVPSTAVVKSDPVLLERIVRNLLANAVHYTGSGRILVGCRCVADFVTIEIWDTGPGIAPEFQAQVFEEFYQIGNPERDRSKGLGLGLAIVKRIAPLVDCSLTLASEQGRGSVFRLRVPRAASGAIPAQGTETPNAVVMPTGMILVVDDELAIQQAIAALLTSWGHQAIVAGSLHEMRAQLVDCAEKPNLSICDFRLRSGETGLATIAGLQADHGGGIPAMLITGDTAPDRISEAQASGYLLLHKPLSNSKLRAAIGNLMREGAAKVG